MPLKDVAAAGGWRDATTLVKSYQQVDDETLVQVELEAPKLCANGAQGGQEVTPLLTASEPVRRMVQGGNL